MQKRPESSAWELRVGVPELVSLLWLTGRLRRCSDAQGSLMRIDAVWQHFTGRAFDAALPDDWLQDVHPDDRPRCGSVHRAMLDSQRSLLQGHAAFAAALANEVGQLPEVQMKSTLDAFAAVARDPMLRRSTSKAVDVWLGEVVDDACAAMPVGKSLPTLLLPAERLEINFD